MLGVEPSQQRSIIAAMTGSSCKQSESTRSLFSQQPRVSTLVSGGEETARDPTVRSHVGFFRMEQFRLQNVAYASNLI